MPPRPAPEFNEPAPQQESNEEPIAEPAEPGEARSTPAPGVGADTSDETPSTPQDTAVPAMDEPAIEAQAQPARVLGSIAGSPLVAEDILVEWHTMAGREVFMVVEKIVATRLALAEATRLGLRLEPGLVELRVAEETRRVSQEIAKNEPDMSIEEFIATRLGVSATAYFDRMRRAAIRQMIMERAVRAWTLSNEWARVRMIVVSGEEDAKAVQTELEGGADFATLARERSLDERSGQAGGLVPFMVRDPQMPIAVAAFDAELGQVVGPMDVGGGQVLLLVEEKHAPLTGAWDVIGSDVNASLTGEPLQDAEFFYWKLTMEQRYPIDVTPLRELLGIGG